MAALWEDIKFDIKHFKDIELLAIVGESQWEKGMAKFCTPFTTAKIRYFDVKQQDEARAWIESGLTGLSRTGLMTVVAMTSWLFTAAAALV